MDVPSMVHRSGDTLIVRSVVSGNQIYMDQEGNHNNNNNSNSNNNNTILPGKSSVASVWAETFQNLEKKFGNAQKQQHQQHPQQFLDDQLDAKDEQLPQCKIKRNYSCSYCTYFTQNPRYHLQHLRDVHGEKIVINKCKLCLYASRHYQKLVRHMKMVHGSTEGIADNGQNRKRLSRADNRKRKFLDSKLSSLNPVLLKIPEQSPSPPKLADFSIPATSTIRPSPLLLEDNSQNRILKCSVCEFSTLFRDQLVDHEQKEHKKTEFFRCEKCNYVTHIKARFSKHVKYHSMPMIKCETCDFRTPYKWNLDRHMKNHGGTGIFKCAACDFTADIKQSLTVHEMNHHIPPVGNAAIAGMNLIRRRPPRIGPNGEIIDDLMDDEDPFNNNNNVVDDFDENFTAKKYKFEAEDVNESDEIVPDDDQPTDLSQKTGPGEPTDLSQKKATRPIPNLIPIQSATSFLSLSRDLAASRTTIKDFASLYFRDNNQAPEILLQMERNDVEQLSPMSMVSKKKPSNFFDKLKESFASNSAQNDNLICNCGHISKCLSELIIHRTNCQQQQIQLHQQSQFLDEEKPPTPMNLSCTSTRCQFCRHRCKSSADLINHMKNCTETNSNGGNESIDESMSGGSGGRPDYEEEIEEIMKHPMENRVFIWNKIHENNMSMGGGSASGGSSMGDPDSPQKRNPIGQGYSSRNEEISYYGVETAPGYGEVTKKMSPDDEAGNSSLKKVYKCPHCSFWASTASRFHVHIVGHLNKKPFECSLCAYRSNWRWDITKHIRLKTIRDPSHKQAHVLMNDETGRRNYTKYNKYITLMKVTEEDGDPKLMKSGEMTPNQEASLAFINEYKNQNSKIMLDENDNDHDQQMEHQQFGTFGSSLLSMQESSSGCSAKNPVPALIKPSDDLITDVKNDGFEKKTSFRCRKCNFKHTNRDAVLAHVKIHYQESNSSKTNSTTTPTTSQNQSNIYNMSNVLAAMCLTQQQFNLTHQQQQQLQQQLQLQQNNNSNLNLGTTSSVPSANSPTSNSSTIVTNEHGETEERHCRLKHGADIRIENIDRTSDKFDPIYRPLLNNGQTQSHNNLHQQRHPTKNSISVSKVDENLHQNEAHMITHSKSKHQKCPSCSYVSESKSQMNYHISIHKSIQYECTLCNFISTKKQQLSNHMKAAHPPGNVVETEEAKVLFGTVSFCSKCPSRFMCVTDLQQHLQMHGARNTYTCEACDFSSKEEKPYLSHSFVHTSDYQDKTQNLLRNNKIDVEHVCPKIIKSSLQNSKLEVWIVEGTAPVIKEEPKEIKEENSLLKKHLQIQSGNGYKVPMSALEEAPDDIDDVDLEKCLYCPYETKNKEQFHNHVQKHVAISKIKENYNCDHCDYTCADEEDLLDHTKCHFKNLMEGHRNVNLFTSFDKLELSLVTDEIDEKTGKRKEISIYKNEPHASTRMTTRMRSNSNKNGKTILVDAKTGQVITRN